MKETINSFLKREGVKLHGDSRLMLIVDRAVNFLGPYFKVPWSIIVPPYVKAGAPHYIGGVITLPPNTTEEKNSQLIGHEVGHWFHDKINPENYRDFLYEGDRKYLELVASYSGLIYLFKKNSLKNPEFRLSYLARINLTEERKRRRELEKFYEKIMIKTNELDKNKSLK